ncbi:uncharacterized protein [Procambarus clarkii]|uniref:uncharacterized protein n=1 Tax=Procambarus clarkii TaxID=6728 RepID=UPI003743F9C0
MQASQQTQQQQAKQTAEASLQHPGHLDFYGGRLQSHLSSEYLQGNDDAFYINPGTLLRQGGLTGREQEPPLTLVGGPLAASTPTSTTTPPTLYACHNPPTPTTTPPTIYACHNPPTPTTTPPTLYACHSPPTTTTTPPTIYACHNPPIATTSPPTHYCHSPPTPTSTPPTLYACHSPPTTTTTPPTLYTRHSQHLSTLSIPHSYTCDANNTPVYTQHPAPSYPRDVTFMPIPYTQDYQPPSDPYTTEPYNTDIPSLPYPHYTLSLGRKGRLASSPSATCVNGCTTFPLSPSKGSEPQGEPCPWEDPNDRSISPSHRESSV